MINVKVDRKRKIPVTVLIRAVLAYEENGTKRSEVGTDEHLRNLKKFTVGVANPRKIT